MNANKEFSFYKLYLDIKQKRKSSIYRDKIFPYIMNKNIGSNEIIELRRNFLKDVKGDILEIGIGSGINVSLYPCNINKINAIDSYVRNISHSSISVSLFNESVEKMHFSDNSFDFVVSTFTFCSVKEIDVTLHEIKRVLRPNGKLIFLEHGRSFSLFISKIQDFFNPLYNIIGCGCNINRDYKESILKAGYKIEKYILKDARIYPKILTGTIHEAFLIK